MCLRLCTPLSETGKLTDRKHMPIGRRCAAGQKLSAGQDNHGMIDVNIMKL